MKPSGRTWATQPAIDDRRARTLALIGSFYDACKVGYQGNEGYRKSTDLRKFVECVRELLAEGLIDPGRTVFTDLGCADGRVNVLMSYFVRTSIGIEIDPDILSEYEPRRKALLAEIEEANLEPPPDNICMFKGSSLDTSIYRRIYNETGLRFVDMDLFYTYITLHDLFAERICKEAKDGALYLVYGFHRVLPSYPGLEVLIPDVGGEQIASLFVKRPESNPVRIRSGTPLDWEFVADLARQVFSTYGEYDRILPTCLGDPQFHTLVIEEKARSVGFCMLSMGDGIGEVVAVAVDPLWQGRGMGKQLMRAMVEDAGRMGIRQLLLRTASKNRIARRLFHGMGFEETGREVGYYAGGQSAITMKKRL